MYHTMPSKHSVETQSKMIESNYNHLDIHSVKDELKIRLSTAILT